MHLAIATSVFVMVFTSISGVVAHGYFEYIGNIQHIEWSYALLLSLGVVAGAQIGAYASKRVSANKLRRVFGAVLAFVSLRMFLIVLFGV